MVLNINREVVYQLLEIEEYEPLINSGIISLYNYADFVMRESDRIKVIGLSRDKYDMKWFQDQISSLDKKRKILHDAAISNISIMNRLAVKHGFEAPYPGDISREQDGREDIALSIFNFAKDALDHDKYVKNME